MEGVIRRSRYARYGSSVKRRRKTNVRQEIVTKIIKQLIVCILILFIITIVKLLNFSPTNNFLAGCNYILEQETNLQSIYGTIDNIVNFFGKNNINDIFSEDAVPTSLTGDGISGREASAALETQAKDSLTPSANSIAPGNDTSLITGYSAGSSMTAGSSSTSVGAATAGSIPTAGNASSSQAVSTPRTATSTNTGTSAAQAALTALKQKYSFQFPVEGIITSGYGNRIHPIKKTEEFHNGIDIEAPKGTPVKAALDGEVIEVAEDASFGKFIRLKTDSELVTVYAHCSQILASKGQKIKKGGIIARVGDTGYSLGTHLHFEVWVNGKTTNPAVFFER